MSTNETIDCLIIESLIGQQDEISKLIGYLTKPIQVQRISTIKELSNVIKNHFDIILLDLELVDLKGLDVLTKVKSIIFDIPIVAFTNIEDSLFAVEVIRQGAEDCLQKKNLSAVALERAIYFAIERYRHHKEQSNLLHQTESYISAYDVLTGLPNQNSFYEHLQECISTGKQKQQLFAMLFICINEIDKVYKTFGHQAGDQLLKTLALKISGFLTNSQFIARYEHNEFVLVMKELTFRKDVAEFSESLQRLISESIVLMDQEYIPTSNMGIVIYPFDGEDADDLINKARTAMKTARESGLNQYVFMSDQIDKLTEEKMIWESEIQYALKNNEFYLNFQPQYSFNGEKLVGAEVLLRWQHRKHGAVSPEKFIGIAEEAGLIAPIGNWVLLSTIKQLQSWYQRGLKKKPFYIAVNISAYQLQHSDLLHIIERYIDEFKIPPQNLEIELTERAIMLNTDLVIKKLRQLQSIGISIAIDDFGTGYSSLSYLGHLPIDKVKLDKAFVKKNYTDPATRTVVRAIIRLAHELGLTVIAEGVETKEELELLRKQGCDVAQGFYFCRPIPVEEFSLLLDLQY